MTKPSALPAPKTLDALQDPCQYIISSCEYAKGWLAQALANQQIERVIELKCQAEAIRIYTLQRQLGKEAELSAAEIVRRAERCIGLAVRKGQSEGKISRRGPHIRDQEMSVREVFGSNNQTRTETYAMTDGVSNEKFESALAEAKEERNLSRANIIRKIHGEQSNGADWSKLAGFALEGCDAREIAKRLGLKDPASVRRKAKELGITIRAEELIGKTHIVRHDRVLREFMLTLDSLMPSCEMIQPEKVNQKLLNESLETLEDALRHLRRLQARMRKASQ